MPKKATRKPSKATKKVMPKKAMPARRAATPARSTVSTPAMMGLSQLLVMYLAFFAVHTLVIFLANVFMPSNVVLGTHIYSPLRGLVQSMAVFTLLTVSATPLLEAVAATTRMKLSTMHWMIGYFVVNAAGLWLTARFAEILGMGIASWGTVLVLALILDVAQGLAVKKVVQAK